MTTFYLYNGENLCSKFMKLDLKSVSVANIMERWKYVFKVSSETDCKHEWENKTSMLVVTSRVTSGWLNLRNKTLKAKKPQEEKEIQMKQQIKLMPSLIQRMISTNHIDNWLASLRFLQSVHICLKREKEDIIRIVLRPLQNYWNTYLF